MKMFGKCINRLLDECFRNDQVKTSFVMKDILNLSCKVNKNFNFSKYF